MTPASDTLSSTFFALADPTRRAILLRLADGAATVKELSAPFDMSGPAISKHLRVLERAGLIQRGREAQWRPRTLDAAPLKEVAEWAGEFRRCWDASYARLDAYLDHSRQRRAAMTSATRTGVTTYAMPNDREVVVTRVVDAPRWMVYDAWTNPRHIPNWLTPDGWSMPVCQIEPRPGAAWRYVYRKPNGREMTLHGVVRELRPPQRIVMTESWGPGWPETVNTVVLTESGGQTLIELTISYPSTEAREAALKTGAKDGLEQGFAKLDQLLETLV